MPLVTITEADLEKVEFNGVLESLGLDIAQTIRSVCDEVAGFVNAHAPNGRCPQGASQVPSELKQATLVLVRQSILGNAPDQADLEGSVRAEQVRSARELLRAVARGEFFISPFEGASEGRVLATGWPLEDFSRI